MLQTGVHGATLGGGNDTPMTRDQEQEERRIGTVVAERYHVTELLGVGGMGAVYRAEDAADGGDVALKILRHRLGASDQASARFEREAFVGSKLVHPNCVGVSDFGRCDDGAIFMAMELLTGEPLGDIMTREGRIPWRRALRIARHVLAGLAHAHAEGIVHRDIKPDNIFIAERDGDPHFARILDFGIAKLLDGGPAITQAGVTVGTPEYLSPEQAVGDKLDGRSDLYSLSIVIYEMLTGRTPFRNEVVAKILVAHATHDVPAFAEIAPDLQIPEAVEALVRDGLTKRKADRIASAGDYIARIDQLLALSTDVEPPGLGTVLDGRYRLEALLGRGGMGAVYRASHIALGRPVAIKVLDPRLTDDEDARRRFEREAQATGKLRHPNCVAVTDYGATPDGGRFLVMELAEGLGLADALSTRPQMPVARAVHIVRHVLRGLAHAHTHGLVHRDLKPENIVLVDEAGDRDFAKILDFGLAKMVAGDDRVTRTGVVCGTPRYMAPEQILDRHLDGRVDLYALSTIFFEMLAGRTPFDHTETTGLLKQHLSAPIPRIGDITPGLVIPSAIEDVIRRGLAKRADERQENADAYLAELDRASPPSANETQEISMAEAIDTPPPPRSAATPPPVQARVVTPAPSVSLPPTKKRTSLLDRLPFTRNQLALLSAAAGLTVIVIIISIAVMTSDDDEDEPEAPPPVTEPNDPKGEPLGVTGVDAGIAAAWKTALAGKGDEAAASLRELKKTRAMDPNVAFALGRVYKRLGRPKQTIAAYREAMKLDRQLVSNPFLIRDIVGLLGTKAGWQPASRMLETEIGVPAISALQETAASHKSPRVRKRAAAVLTKLLPAAGGAAPTAP